MPNSAIAHVSVSPPLIPDGRLSRVRLAASDLHALSPQSLPILTEDEVHAHIHPSSVWFTLQIAQGSVYHFHRPESCLGVILTGDRCTESPFAFSGCYPSECHIACDIDRRYSILFARTGSCAQPQPSRSLSLSPCATSPCRLLRTPAGSWPFPTLSPQSFYGCLDPYPAALLRCSCSFLPGQHRPHLRRNRFGALEPPSP